jgi:hypothetical protein
MTRSIRIYEIFYQTHSLEPAPTEEFHYYPTEQMIYIYDTVLPPTEGLVLAIVEIINVRHVTSMCCLPTPARERCICEDVPNPNCKAH